MNAQMRQDAQREVILEVQQSEANKQYHEYDGRIVWTHPDAVQWNMTDSTPETLPIIPTSSANFEGNTPFGSDWELELFKPSLTQASISSNDV